MKLKEFANMVLGLKREKGAEIFKETFGFEWEEKDCAPYSQEVCGTKLAGLTEVIMKMIRFKEKILDADKARLHPYVCFLKMTATSGHWCKNTDRVIERFKQVVAEIEEQTQKRAQN